MKNMLNVKKAKQIFADMLCVCCSLMGIFFLMRIFIEKDGILFLVMSFLTLECLFLWAAFRALRPYYGNGLSEWKDELREDGFAQTFTKLWLRMNMRLLGEFIPHFFWVVIFLLIVIGIVVVTMYLYHHLQWVS